jgi:hypothetical protein
MPRMRHRSRDVLAILVLCAAALPLSSCWSPAQQPDGLPSDGSKAPGDAGRKDLGLEAGIRQAAAAAAAWEDLSRAARTRAAAVQIAQKKAEDDVSHLTWGDGVHDLSRFGGFLDGNESFSRHAAGMVHDARKALAAATELVKASEVSGTWQALAETAKANAARAEQEWATTLADGVREADRALAFQLWLQQGSPAIWRLVEGVAKGRQEFARIMAEAERATSLYRAAVVAERAAADWAAQAAAAVVDALEAARSRRN